VKGTELAICRVATHAIAVSTVRVTVTFLLRKPSQGVAAVERMQQLKAAGKHISPTRSMRKAHPTQGQSENKSSGIVLEPVVKETYWDKALPRDERRARARRVALPQSNANESTEENEDDDIPNSQHDDDEEVPIPNTLSRHTSKHHLLPPKLGEMTATRTNLVHERARQIRQTKNPSSKNSCNICHLLAVAALRAKNMLLCQTKPSTSSM
jgi:hypothetical protein